MGSFPELEVTGLDDDALRGFLETAGFCSCGNFLVTINMSGEESSRRKHVDFTPTAEMPNIVRYVAGKLDGELKMVERLVIQRNGGGRLVSTFPKNIHQHDFD